MKVLSKEKILGQFFSGSKIPNLLASLLELDDIHTIIDPMCGSGDMFSPFLSDKYSTWGIEIDNDTSSIAKNRYPKTNIINNDAFCPEIYSSFLGDTGFDLVITNPPYVRRELLNPSTSLGFHNNIETIKLSLCKILEQINYLTQEEKGAFQTCINSFSRLSDLSIPSWILCLMLMRHGGQLALVLPTAWLSREYAQPLIRLFDSLCQIKYIVIDKNRTWFKNNAQVQTSLVIARRKYPEVAYIHHTIRYVELYDVSANEQSLIGNLPNTIDFISAIKCTHSHMPFFRVKQIVQEDLIRTDVPIIGGMSQLSQFVDVESNPLVSLSDLNINVGQGLRTGANDFFYLRRAEDKCYSRIYLEPINFNKSIFQPVIKTQEVLDETYSVNTVPNDVLLNIQTYATHRDKASAINQAYDVLDIDIEKYIEYAENYKIKGKYIPDLSAVKTNVSTSKNKIKRFWYMLPTPCSRHYADLFIPRVNSTIPICRLNQTSEEIFIDANFNSIWSCETTPLDKFSILALLNSKWALIQYEELGTIMGGGALKLDAVQLKRTLFPKAIVNYNSELTRLGKSLCECRFNVAATIISKIDNIILRAIGINDNSINTELQTILDEYLLCRK